MSYDARCHDLARAFLRDHEPLSDKVRDALADELAQEIQRAIEDFLLDHFGRTAA